jgi:pimeloyl-ACP methyl ester carboxylesterase
MRWSRPGHGPLVLLLHGFPSSGTAGGARSRRWRAPAAASSPDQRGYNLTGKQPPYDLATLVADMVALVRALGYPRACVAGHDWGAVVAWDLAARHPELVERLAILNVPHPAVMARALRGGNPRQMLRSWYMFYFQIPGLPEAMLRAGDYRGLERAMAHSARPGTFTPADFAHYRRAPGATRRAQRDDRLVPRDRARQPAAACACAGDARIRVPTLVLWGERDLALGVELAEQSLALLDDGRLVRYPLATHWVHEDLPEEVNARLLDHFGQE